MQAFEFHSPTKIIFGTGTEDQTGRRVAEYGGSRVLVVYGGQSAVKSGLLDRIKASLEEAGLTYETLGGVTPNPRLSFARAGVEKVQHQTDRRLLRAICQGPRPAPRPRCPR